MPHKKTTNQNKKIVYAVVIGVLIIAMAIAATYFFGGISSFKKTFHVGINKKIIDERILTPDTKKINWVDGKILSSGEYAIPLNPEIRGEEIIVPNAINTIIGAYEIALPGSLEWSRDAKLAFIKSLGAVTLDGKSSSWQVVFASISKKKKVFEAIIQKNEIISEKEIDSSVVVIGADVPSKWPDVADFIRILQSRAVFSDATVTSFLFGSTPESTDTKWWLSLNTSKGVVTFEIR